MKPILTLATLTVLLLPATMQAQLTARQAFATAPQSVFPLLDTNTRLDMIDYFDAGMKNESKNALGGQSALLEVSPMSLSMKMSDASTNQVFLLPAAGNDTIIGVIRTVATPGHDSSLSLYTSKWQPVAQSKRFNAPKLTDWVTDRSHLGDVEAVVPFMLTGYKYDPQRSTLTLENNLNGFLSDDIYEMVAPYMLSSLTYEWDGKKFTLRK